MLLKEYSRMLLSQEVDGGMSRVQEVVQVKVGVMTELDVMRT